MDGDGTDPRDQVFPLLAHPVRNLRIRALLERAEASFRDSAALLLAAGQADDARRAEQFAEWTRLDLDRPDAILALRSVVRSEQAVSTVGTLLDDALDFAMAMLCADRGNIQIAAAGTRTLRIASQRGFDAEFLEYFAVVADDGSACGRAAQQRSQVIIEDVTTDPAFAPHREIAAASGFRAVQSTPLVNRAGQVMGVLSTHYPRPVTLPVRDLQLIARFGALIGDRLSVLLDGGHTSKEQ